jgi:hypothetical protein
MIKVIINVETDCDFKLGFPKLIKGLRQIRYDEDYFIELHLNEETAKTDVIEFLREVDIYSSKEWHKEQLEIGIDDYEIQLKNGLCSSFDFFGGNWLFKIEMCRVTEECL